MNVILTINTDNAAFESHAGQEVARILRRLAARVEDWPGASEFAIGVRDANGNKVGICKAEKK